MFSSQLSKACGRAFSSPIVSLFTFQIWPTPSIRTPVKRLVCKIATRLGDAFKRKASPPKSSVLFFVAGYSGFCILSLCFGWFRTKALRGVEEAGLTAEFRGLSVRGSPTLVWSVEKKENNVASWSTRFSPTYCFENPWCSRS